MSRIRVAVVRGGFGPEYRASLWTGAFVLEHIDRNRYNPLDIVITQNGEWLVDGVARMPEHILHSVDVIFNALHGTYGEDGTVQRLFERFGVPYTGSAPLASGISMNKVATKHCLRGTPIQTPPHVHLTQDSLQEIGRVSQNIISTFGPEYIIKPVNASSSSGVMSVKNPLLLTQALKDALKTYDEVMVEARIPGREVTCGVIHGYRDEELYALPPLEVVLPKDHSVYSAHLKEIRGAETHCPSHFDSSTKREIERLAKLVHQTINLSQYSRSDFIVADSVIYFLEINALPRVREDSHLMQSLTAVGGTYTDFITHILDDALSRRHKTRW